jgi:hypothetical protein
MKDQKNGAPHCCGPGSKGAETQRNEGLLQENAKPACGRQGAKKNLLAAWRLCKKKKIAHERQKKNSARRIKKRYGAQRCRDAKK